MILSVHRDIVKKFSLVAITFFSYFSGITFYIYGTGLFLDKLGPEELPKAHIGTAVIVIVYSFVSSYLNTKLRATRIFSYMTALLAVFYFALNLNVPFSASQIFVFFLLNVVLMLFLDITITNVVNSLITPLQAKTYLPLLQAGSSLGVIVGSLSIPVLQSVYEKIGMWVIPSITALVLALLMLVIEKLFMPTVELNLPAQHSTQRSSLGGLKKTFKFILDTKLFRMMIVMFFLLAGIQSFTEFKFKTMMGQTFHAHQLTEIIGYVYFAKSAGSFLISFFVSKKLLFKYGVSNLLISFPLILGIFLVIAVVTGLHPFAVIAFFLVFSLTDFSYIPVSLAQIVTAAPKDMSRSVYFILRGVVFSFSMLVMSCFLMIYSFNINLEKTLNTGIIATFLLFFGVSAILVKKYYAQTLNENLFRKDTDLKLRSIELLAEQSNREKGETHLRRMLKIAKTEDDVRIKTINTLGIISNYNSVADLMLVLKSKNPKEQFAAVQAINSIIRGKRSFNDYPVTKHLLLKAYEHIFISDTPIYVKIEVISSLKYFHLEDIIAFLERHLYKHNPQIQGNIIETLGFFSDRATITYLEPFLHNENLRLVSGAIAAQWKFSDMRIFLIPKIAEILSRKEPESIQNALFLIGAIHANWERNFVIGQLSSPHPHLRVYAVITLIVLGEKMFIDKLLKEMLSLAQKGDRQELEFILSHYRRLDRKAQASIITKIQHMEPKDVRYFYQIFHDSRYVFQREIADLS